MITTVKSIYHPNGTRSDHVVCTHADVENPALAGTWAKIEKNGARRQFIDADPVTGEVGVTEMYDEDAGEWVEQPTGGGGGEGGTTRSILTSQYQIGSANKCIKRGHAVEFAIVLTISSAAVDAVIASLPEGYRPDSNHQITCYGLTGNQFLNVLTSGNIVLQGASITASTVLRIHSFFISA